MGLRPGPRAGVQAMDRSGNLILDASLSRLTADLDDVVIRPAEAKVLEFRGQANT